jgi:hypothetical protein
VALAKARFKQVFDACLVRGEQSEKLTDRDGGLFFLGLFHGPKLAYHSPYVKGILPKNNNPVMLADHSIRNPALTSQKFS